MSNAPRQEFYFREKGGRLVMVYQWWAMGKQIDSRAE
jgi:hypothetical protein